MSKAVYWFRNDLRLADNTGWSRLARRHEQVLGLYVLPEHCLRPGYCRSQGISMQRMRFLLASLLDLRTQLRAVGSDLLVVSGRVPERVCSVLQQQQADELAVAEHPGSYEVADIEQVKVASEVPVHVSENFTLFDKRQLPFELDALPQSFSAFRKKVESLSLTPGLTPSEPQPLPETFKFDVSECELDKRWALVAITQTHEHALPFTGGRQTGLQQLNHYLFDSRRIEHYKKTRNGLDGWEFSSKLSPWLALGCFSAREMAEAIQRYETQIRANESTYWLYFELLWREYFQWLAYRHGERMFAWRGIREIDPELSFNEPNFTAWCTGTTDSDFVNAFMRQLKATGWMSNRGRQIVASYFVNELNLDWRYGAAWFEQQLLDYDVASNWGNWLYLAGVGTDPRGRRKFNIEKQQSTYDPEGQFIAAWASVKSKSL